MSNIKSARESAAIPFIELLSGGTASSKDWTFIPIPMHMKGSDNGELSISSVDPFQKVMRAYTDDSQISEHGRIHEIGHLAWSPRPSSVKSGKDVIGEAVDDVLEALELRNGRFSSITFMGKLLRIGRPENEVVSDPTPAFRAMIRGLIIAVEDLRINSKLMRQAGVEPPDTWNPFEYTSSGRPWSTTDVNKCAMGVMEYITAKMKAGDIFAAASVFILAYDTPGWTTLRLGEFFDACPSCALSSHKGATPEAPL